jgi:X8 domain
VHREPSFAAVAMEMSSVNPSQKHIRNMSRKMGPPCDFFKWTTKEEEILSWHSAPRPIDLDLPPTPYPQLCTCMMGSLRCLANHTLHETDENINQTEIADPEERRIAHIVCNESAASCLGSGVNVANGQYGTFSSCNPTERGSWMLNQHYQTRKEDPESCTSLGGVIRNDLPQSQSKVCPALLRQAGPLGTGTITDPLPTDEMPDTLSKPRRLEVVIGIVLFLLIIVCGIFLWLRKRHKNISLRQAQEVEEFRKAELPDNLITPPKSGPFELNTTACITEMEGSEVASPASVTELVELPTPYNEGPPFIDDCTSVDYPVQLKYWCKHCGFNIPNTRVDREQHESTIDHQNAIQVSLRNENWRTPDSLV